MSKRKSPKTGRPVTKTMPPRIEATPEEIAQVVLQVTPPKKWRYLSDSDGDENEVEGPVDTKERGE